MKKIILIITLIVTTIFLVSCSNSANTIKVVATEKPHAEILRQAQPILKDKGFKLKIIHTDNYAFGNPEVERGKADANFFQHLPYFNEKNVNNKLSNVGGVHIEPIGLYSGKKNSIEELEAGDTIYISDNTPDNGRLVLFLENLGLVETIDGFEPTNTYSNPEEAIKSKTVDFKIKSIEANLLATARRNKEGALFFINGNYALTAGLTLKDAIRFEETTNNPYVNIVVTKNEDVDSPKIKTLMEVLLSKEIKDFITNNYDGSVIPA